MMDMAGGLAFNFHGLTGLLAILLMLLHAIWASLVLLRRRQRAILNFHKFSLLVWIIWLVPYLSPMLFGLV